MYWRRRLPHWVPDECTVFVTWRLAGTLPYFPAILINDPRPGRTFLLQDQELDRTPGGPRWLKDPRIASMVADALEYGAGARGFYDLLAWVIMPNHVHVVLQPHAKLPEVMRWLKTATAHRANALIGRKGVPFWSREYYDRWVRSDQELQSVIAYVERNPVAAGLAACPEDWPWSSAAGVETPLAGRGADVTE